MAEINITEDGVVKVLYTLNPHKSAEHDKIKVSVLKELAEMIIPIVARIFRASLEQGRPPEVWKDA